MIVGRGGAGEGAADVKRGSRRGSSGVRGEGNMKVQRDGRGKIWGWRAKQAGGAIYC